MIKFIFRERSDERKYSNTIWMHVVLLILLISFQQLVPLGSGNLFGTEGDWYTQHVAIAETIRQAMLDSGKWIPQYVLLGGGSSIYDFSYYGVLRPDILISCLFPEIEMKYFISGYALLGIYVSGILCYFWLKKNRISPWFSFVGSVLFASSSCFYHSQHQIMFVNYMPFLILALWGVQRVLEEEKSGLLMTSLLFIYLHSFYYSPSCLCVVGIFSLYHIWNCRKEKDSREVWIKGIRKLFAAVLISMGLAMILLLPTALNLLSTTKDAGRFAKETLKIVDLSAEGLLYHPYGCGLTILVLYCMFLNLYQKKKRFWTGTLLICMLLPVVSLVLNCFLYARAKILIPFMPLLVFFTVDTLWVLWKGKYVHKPGILLICLIPAFFSEWNNLLIVDVLILGMWIYFQQSKMKKLQKHQVKKITFGLCLLVPTLLSFEVSKSNSKIEAKDERQSWVKNVNTEAYSSDHLYRFDVNTAGLTNCNLTKDHLNRVSMYSSITNNRYAEFFYDTMKNAISYNNRVALVAGNNPCFQYFMGIKYSLRQIDGKYVIEEKENVLPICYGTANLISQKMYETLDFPNTIEALCTGAVVAGNVETKNFESYFVKEDLDSFFADDEVQRILKLNGEQKEQFSLKLAQTLTDKILILQFQVDSLNGGQVDISINGTNNKLSAETAPYPNDNHTFTYFFETGEKMEKLMVEASKGKYEITDLKIYTIDQKYMVHNNVTIPECVDETDEDGDRIYGMEKADVVFEGKIDMEEDGYFITSFPYKDGYQIFIDGRKIGAEIVNTAFLGFPVTEGKHEIGIYYEAPGYIEGQVITVLSSVLYFGVLLNEKCKRSIRK